MTKKGVAVGFRLRRSWSAISKTLRRYVFILLPITTLLLSSCSSDQSSLNPQNTDTRHIATLAWVMFAIAAVVFTVVTLLILAAILRGRREQDTPAVHLRDRRALVLIIIGGGLIPLVVLLVIMGFSIGIEREASAESSDPGTIEVIGHQWWWEVRYPNEGVVTANEIHIPAGRTIHVKLTSADVIHSFWVPELTGKLDVLPDQTNTLDLKADQPGEYHGQCAEYCGFDLGCAEQHTGTRRTPPDQTGRQCER